MTEGFNIRRKSRSRIGTADKAKATMNTTSKGKDYILHVSGKGVPSIGYHLGKNWTLHVDEHNVPTITGKK